MTMASLMSSWPTIGLREPVVSQPGRTSVEEVGLPWGVAFDELGAATASMGVAAGDHDGDGRTDLLVTNFFEEGVTLYRNAAPGRFEAVTARNSAQGPDTKQAWV